MKVGSGEIQTESIHSRVPDHVVAPSLTTVHVKVAVSPEKIGSDACSAETATEATLRSAGRASTSASTVSVLFVSSDSSRLGGNTASAITVTWRPRVAGERSNFWVFV